MKINFPLKKIDHLNQIKRGELLVECPEEMDELFSFAVILKVKKNRVFYHVIYDDHYSDDEKCFDCPISWLLGDYLVELK